MTADFIVIGAGPAGSRAAAQLAASGHRVLVLERAPAPGHKRSCTGIISMECVRAFDIPNDVILRTASGATLFSPSGIAVHVSRDTPQAVILDRPAFDNLLARRAMNAGAEIRFNCRVTDITPGPDKVPVSYESPDGPKTAEARAVILASGYSPNLVKALGLGDYRDSAAGVQANVAADIDEVEVYFGDTAPKFFAWLVPAAPGRVKAGLLSRDNADEKLKAWLEKLAAAGRIESPEAEIHYGRVPLRPLRRTYGDRLLVVGDAAGQVKPLTGGGIYFGMLAADLAADTLQQAAARDDFSAASLSNYEKAWQKKLGRELRWGYRDRKLSERLGRRSLDSLFRWVARSGVNRTLAEADDLAFDWHARALGRLVRLRLTSPFRRRSRA